MLKARTYRKVNTVKLMPDRNCYLVETASVPIGLLRDNAEYDAFEPANNQNCLKSVDCFLVENDNYEFILKHLYI